MYAFIVNPNARSGLGIRIWRTLEEELKKENIPYEIYFTHYKGHATEYAGQISETADSDPVTIVAIGGDGTIGEVLDGITDFSSVSFSYIPIGSGNDFAKSMGIHKDPMECLRQILKGNKTMELNAGVSTFGKQKRTFAVSSGIGFDAEVCFHNDSSKVKQLLNRLNLGKLSYTFVALKLLLGMHPTDASITIDDKAPIHYKRVYFAAAMNQRYEGGGFKFCPKAKPDDGFLDLLVVENISKLKILCVLPLAYLGGHVFFKGVHIFTCKKAQIVMEEPVAIHTDGEADHREREVTFSLREEPIHFIYS